MAIFFIILLLITEILVCGTAVALMALLIFGAVTTRVPFVPMPWPVVNALKKEVLLGAGDVLYDLGSGDGRVVFAMAAAYPNARTIGIEKAPLPFILSQVRGRFARKPNAAIRRENFMQTPLAGATQVFTYLFPETMQELLPKFERELPKGARVISCDFPFKEREANRTLPVGKYTLYFYEF
jgi:hypothetical protein